MRASRGPRASFEIYPDDASPRRGLRGVRQTNSLLSAFLSRLPCLDWVSVRCVDFRPNIGLVALRVSKRLIFLSIIASRRSSNASSSLKELPERVAADCINRTILAGSGSNVGEWHGLRQANWCGSRISDRPAPHPAVDFILKVSTPKSWFLDSEVLPREDRDLRSSKPTSGSASVPLITAAQYRRPLLSS